MFYIVILIFGVLLGGVVGMTSIGNGLIGTPGLFLLGVDKFEAVGTIGLAGVLMMLSSVAKHYKNSNVNLPTVIWFSVTAVPMSFISAQYKESLNEYVNLTYIIGAVIILSIITLTYKFFICTKKDEAEFKNNKKSNISSIVLGLFLGFFIGATSISGSLTVIALMLCLKMPERLAIGTTSCIAIFSLIAASVAHVSHGHINWLVFMIFSPAVMVGGYFGAHLTDKMPQKPLRIIVLSLLFIAAIFIFLKNGSHDTEDSHGAAVGNEEPAHVQTVTE